MKAVILKDLKYSYATDLNKGDIVDIKDSSIKDELLVEKDENRLIDRKNIAFLTSGDVNVFTIYKNILTLLDKADLNISKRNMIINGLRKIYVDLKIDILD